MAFFLKRIWHPLFVCGIVISALFCTRPLFGAVEGRYFHYFALEGNYVLLRRTNSHSKPLVMTTATSDGTPVSVLNSNNLIREMSFDSAVSAALKVFYGIHSTLEARYLGRFQWKGERDISGDSDLLLPNNFGDDTVDYISASRGGGIYRSDMYSAELNYWRHVTPRYTDHFSVSWLMGLRFFNIKEKLKLLFGSIHQVSRYRIRTKSRSLGLQAGFSLEYNPYSFLTWGGVIKAGGLFNRGRQSTLFLDSDNHNTLLEGAKSGSNFGYCAQVYPFIEWRPTKFFNLTIYYQVLYVGGVNVADGQLFFDEVKLSSHGDIIYHGLTGVLQFNF